MNLFTQSINYSESKLNQTELQKNKFLEILKGPMNKINKLIQEIIKEYNDKIFSCIKDLKYSGEDYHVEFNHLFPILVIKCLTWFHQNFNLFFNLIYENYYKNILWEKQELEKKEITQFSDLPKFLLKEMNKSLQNAIDINLGEDFHNPNIDTFISKHNTMKEICKNYISEFKLNSIDIFSKYESGNNFFM